jgi:hypothetical protein
MPLTLDINPAEKVAGHVAQNWFPVNKAHLNEIREGLIQGAYSKNSLLIDIKSDIGLYTLCIRRLSQMASDGGVGGLTPVELFNHAELETLSALVTSDIDRNIHHKLQTASDVQVGRLKETMLSATTAEALVEAKSISAELGFSCAVLRQLGLTLIAWNYPHVYRRALENSGLLNTNLEGEIQKILGFTPASLAVAITKDWNLSPIIKEVMTERGADGSDILSDTSKNVLEACKVGEALARANDPENYPSALHDWNTAEEAIEKSLGNKGMIRIRETIARNLRGYATSFPKTFNIPNADTIPSKICNVEYSRNLLAKNEHLSKCSPLLKMQLRELYSAFTPNEIARDSIQKLVRDIVPGAGFAKGCIFMYEQSTHSLVPVLKIGGIAESMSGTISLREPIAKDNLVAAGYLASTPIQKTQRTPNGIIESSWYSGGLGTDKKTGVLLLEANSSLLGRSEINPESLFLAIKQCLADCLGIK